MKLHLPKFPLTKPNQHGFGHVELLVLVVFVAIFAFVGVRVLTQSHADPLLTSTTCQLRGRAWASNGCTKTCLSGAGSHVVANPYDYCSNALSKISASTCAANGRKYINVGCARRWQQTNLKGAIQCVSSTATYTVKSSIDACVAGTTAAKLFSCKFTASPAIVPGKSSLVTVTFSNLTSLSIQASPDALFAVPENIHGIPYTLGALTTVAPGTSKTLTKTITAPATAYHVAFGASVAYASSQNLIDPTCTSGGYYITR